MSTFRNWVNAFEFESELPGSRKTVIFKPITTGQIKRLLLYETSEDLDSIENALDNIITECVISDDFNIDDLYLQDRFYLLLDLRKATKGNTYSFQSKCNKCDSQSAQSVNLSELPVKKLEIEAPIETTKQSGAKSKGSRVTAMKKGGALIEDTDKSEDISLPVQKSVSDKNLIKLNDNVSIRVSYLTRKLQKDVKSIIDSIKDLAERQKDIEESTLMFAVAITSVITPEGEETNLSIEDKNYLIENLTPAELELVSKWFDDNDFGVDFSFDVICAHCNNIERKNIPLENFFF